MRKLTAAEAKSIKRPGMYRAGDTLYLRISSTGAKSWVQRIMVDGRRRDIGLGSFSLVSLAEAREKAHQNRRLARVDGVNPLAAKRKAKVPTFAEAALKTHEALKPTWRNEKHAVSWMQTLEKYAMPRLGDMRVDKIGREDMLAVLTSIWASRPETARRVRQRIGAVMEWSQAHDFVAQNVARDAISGALPKLPKVKEHYRTLPYREVAEALEIIEASKASMSAKSCFRFLVLTAARSGEARGATWDEINLESREWRIPASRMKAYVEHRVPLSDEAVAVLEKARALDDGSGLVFPSPVRKGKPLSDMTLTKVLRDNGFAERATVHGFRSTFRDWCAETGKPREPAEAALAHIVGGVEGAYFRSDLFAKRRRLMESWGAFVAGSTGRKVVRLHG